MAFVDKDTVTTRKGTGYVCRYRDNNGRSRERVVYGMTRKQAEKFARDLEAENRTARVDLDRSRTRFRDLAEEWLETRTKPRPETVANYRRLLTSWVLPEIGDTRLDQLTNRDLTRLYNKICSSPTKRTRGRRKGSPPPTVSAQTVVRIFGPVVSVLRYGVDHDYLVKNPARGIDFRPTRAETATHGVALEWEEVVAVADGAATTDPLYGLVVRFLASTGVRAGELMGLQVGDVRRGRKPGEPDVLVVERSAVEDREGLRYKKPKSGHSNRRVPLDADIAKELRNHLAVHPRRSDPTAPLFPRRSVGGEFDAERARNGTRFNWELPIDPGNFRRRVFLPACEAAGLGRLRLHDLRDTAGSLWIAAGWNLFDVSRSLGHASVDFTMRVYAKQLNSTATTNAAALAKYKRARRPRHLQAV